MLRRGAGQDDRKATAQTGFTFDEQAAIHRADELSRDHQPEADTQCRRVLPAHPIEGLEEMFQL